MDAVPRCAQLEVPTARTHCPIFPKKSLHAALKHASPVPLKDFKETRESSVILLKALSKLFPPQAQEHLPGSQAQAGAEEDDVGSECLLRFYQQDLQQKAEPKGIQTDEQRDTQAAAHPYRVSKRGSFSRPPQEWKRTWETAREMKCFPFHLLPRPEPSCRYASFPLLRTCRPTDSIPPGSPLISEQVFATRGLYEVCRKMHFKSKLIKVDSMINRLFMASMVAY